MALGPLLLLAACGDDPAPARYPPPSYDYLTKVELKVARIEIDDSWVCTACAALDLYEKEHENTPQEPGTLLRVIYTREHHH